MKWRLIVIFYMLWTRCGLSSFWETLKKVFSALVYVVCDTFWWVGGRERGIRTPGGITLTGFQDRHIRPLWHLPTFCRIEFYLKKIKSSWYMEEPTRLELVNSRFAIYGLTNLAMAPSYKNRLTMEESPGIEHRDNSVASCGLNTWLWLHIWISHPNPYTKFKLILVVPGAGLEPARSQWPGDFKSPVSTIPPPGLNWYHSYYWNVNCLWSGRTGSNRRPQPWQGYALPLSYARKSIPKYRYKSKFGVRL